MQKGFYEEDSKEDWEERKGRRGALYHHQLKHVFTHFTMMINVFVIPKSNYEELGDTQFISHEKISIFAFSTARHNYGLKHYCPQHRYLLLKRHCQQ